MLEIVIAFGAGLISFLSPCVLPLIPGYVSYVTGNSIQEFTASKNVNLIPIILFTVGFSIVFIFFGAAATFIGKFLLSNSNELRIIAGIIIIIFSLQILGIFNFQVLNYEKRFHTKKKCWFFRASINWPSFWIWLDALYRSNTWIYIGISIYRRKFK